MKAVGSRAEVMHGSAQHTSGYLKKTDLMFVKGRIVSKQASKSAKLRLKGSVFEKFVKLAKTSKHSTKLKLSPKKNTVAYKKLIKQKK